MKETASLALLVLVLGVATWFGGRAYLSWQTKARMNKAAVEMQELRQALVEYNEELKAKQVGDASAEAVVSASEEAPNPRGRF